MRCVDHSNYTEAFTLGNPKIRRLFTNTKAAEQDYFRKTKVFPIMHAVAVRTEIAENNPTLLKALFNAYSEAKRIAYDDLATTTALRVTLPWVTQEFAETQSIMGRNFWSHGIAANRKELDLVMRYTFEQGLTKRRARIEEIFHPSTLELLDAVQ